MSRRLAVIAFVLLAGCAVTPAEDPRPRRVERLERVYLPSQDFRPDSLGAGPDTTLGVRVPGTATDVRFTIWTDRPAMTEIIVGMPTNDPRTWPAIWSGVTEQIGRSHGATVVTPPLEYATRDTEARVVVRGANSAICQATWLYSRVSW